MLKFRFMLHVKVSLENARYLAENLRTAFFGKFLVTSLHVIYGLVLPQSKILCTPMNRRSPKNFFEDLFFREHLRLCPWPWPRAFLFLASRGSVLGKAVLGLGVFCVLGLEPCVLDSTSGKNPFEVCSSRGITIVLRDQVAELGDFRNS